jgi:hypothetical protein
MIPPEEVAAGSVTNEMAQRWSQLQQLQVRNRCGGRDNRGLRLGWSAIRLGLRLSMSLQAHRLYQALHAAAACFQQPAVMLPV